MTNARGRSASGNPETAADGITHTISQPGDHAAGLDHNASSSSSPPPPPYRLNLHQSYVQQTGPVVFSPVAQHYGASHKQTWPAPAPPPSVGYHPTYMVEHYGPPEMLHFHDGSGASHTWQDWQQHPMSIPPPHQQALGPDWPGYQNYFAPVVPPQDHVLMYHGSQRQLYEHGRQYSATMSAAFQSRAFGDYGRQMPQMSIPSRPPRTRPQTVVDHAAQTPSLTPSYPRGPPRKPKQSGFALWVGNLPPNASITDLKDFFSRGAPDDIESLFHIARSNCAFVNYRTSQSCQAAQQRYHDARFQGTRLVCRLRHLDKATPTSPIATSGTWNLVNGEHAPLSHATQVPVATGGRPAVATGGQLSDESDGETHDGIRGPASQSASPGKARFRKSSVARAEAGGTEDVSSRVGASTNQEGSLTAVFEQKRELERMFIVKSLTQQDLQASLRNGIWATQAHNEALLSSAFATSENVYLVFSANKSGEYFGFARMTSPIDPERVSQNPQPCIETNLKDVAVTDGPITIPTAATQHARKGRIVDDSARGTMFWEVDTSSSDESQDDDDHGSGSDKLVDGGVSSRSQANNNKSSSTVRVAVAVAPSAAAETIKQDWGRPFKIEWMSTTPLPFHKTRGLRNPWNQNREVKIARDGTELEPTIGRKLLDLFQMDDVKVDGGNGGGGGGGGYAREFGDVGAKMGRVVAEADEDEKVPAAAAAMPKERDASEPLVVSGLMRMTLSS